MIRQSYHETQTENVINTTDSDLASNATKGLAQVSNSQLDMHTFEENFVGKVQSEIDSVLTTVESRIQDAALLAIENLVIPRVELATKSINASSGRSVYGIVLDPDRKDFSGNTESLKMAASSSINSHKDLNRIDETRGNITIEGSDLLVNEKNFDRQTHTHHSLTFFPSLSIIYSIKQPQTRSVNLRKLSKLILH